MRLKFILSMFTAALIVGLAVPAHAAQVVYWKGAVAKTSAPLNAACPEDTNKVIVVSLRVRKGEKIKDPGVFTLNMKNGRNRTSDDGYIVPGKKRRLAEYYFFLGRRAKVDRAHPRDSYAFPVELTVGAHPRIVLRADCLGMVP